MLNIAICDDDLIFASKIETLLLQISQNRFIEMSIDVYSDGYELWNEISSGKEYELLYLDIEMVRFNGIDVAKKIREINMDSVIIYISSYDNYFIDLFEVEPFRFIRKPVNENIFLDYFQKAYEKIIREDAYFEYKFNKITYKVLTRNIMFFESTGRIINVHNKDFTGKFYGKLNTIERKLEDGKVPFLRIHQSYLVNYGFIKEITFSKVVLTNGIQLQISEERQKLIRAKYTSFLGGEFLDG